MFSFGKILFPDFKIAKYEFLHEINEKKSCKSQTIKNYWRQIGVEWKILIKTYSLSRFLFLDVLNVYWTEKAWAEKFPPGVRPLWKSTSTYFAEKVRGKGGEV